MVPTNFNDFTVFNTLSDNTTQAIEKMQMKKEVNIIISVWKEIVRLNYFFMDVYKKPFVAAIRLFTPLIQFIWTLIILSTCT